MSSEIKHGALILTDERLGGELDVSIDSNLKTLDFFIDGTTIEVSFGADLVALRDFIAALPAEAFELEEVKEPKGIAAAVKDAEGEVWVRRPGEHDEPWVCSHSTAAWDGVVALGPVTLEAEGVTPA